MSSSLTNPTYNSLRHVLAAAPDPRPAPAPAADRLLPSSSCTANTAASPFPPGLSFQDTKIAEDETSALLPKVDKLDIFCPSNAQGSPPSREREMGRPRKQTRQWHLRQSSHHPLDSLSYCIKYLAIVWNLVFSITGLLILAIGMWGLSDKESLASEQVTYLGSDPMLFFVLVGLVASIMSLLGCTGTLFENTCLLKLFTGGIITFVILEALGGIVLFSLRHQIKASLQNSLMVAVLRYQDDPDLQFIMDEIQMGLQCCGVESYLNWKTNLYFNCSSPGMQAGGVPASCCLDPLENSTIPNSQCGFGTLVLEESVAQSTIYLGGCVPQLSRWFNNHAGAIGFYFAFLIVIEVGSLLLATKRLAGIAFARTQYYSEREETYLLSYRQRLRGFYS
ncbi:LOW QUALITY PROTEIN: tetraspanin-10 [Rhineura floridana]|uniref:LOW QUALITY PROTEIN: tetraspanin-10 n=1 Tax=Rhineura floridana TaxID=261503 RepID=UPI002AC7F641|nr:LOW QUALITY PROTEIN: tetraspanin-10 [Rhineura floridana]